MKLAVRYLAWSAATFLASFSTALGLGSAAWKAAVIAGAAGVLPGVQLALLEYARTGTVPDPPTETTL